MIHWLEKWIPLPSQVYMGAFIVVVGVGLSTGTSLWYSTPVSGSEPTLILTLPVNEVAGRLLVFFGVVSACMSNYAGKKVSEALARVREGIHKVTPQGGCR